MRILILLFIVALCSCNSGEWYSSVVTIPESGWHKDTVAVFKSEITRLDESCHLLLQVNNKDDYQYSNIWFFIDAISPSGNVQRDTLECALADVQGKWYGKSAHDHTFESLHPYKINIRFPEEGLYKYYVVHGMRDTVLTGIESVGLKIIDVKK